jgi:fructokinase
MTRPIIFGEVLYDCFPDGSRVLGGAPFNVAWHLQAFGVAPLFISRVGNDPMGRQIRDAMLQWGMDTSGLQLDSSHATGAVDVSFIDNEPRYEIVESRAWDFIDADVLPPQLPSMGILYHGSLALRNDVSAAALDTIKKTTSSGVFLDVNLRPPWWNISTIRVLVSGPKWIKLNTDELAEIVPHKSDILSRLTQFFEDTNLKFLILTEGEAGARVITPQGGEYRVIPPPNSDVIDTVGAGDAFTSVVLLGEIKGWNIEVALRRAQDFASEIVAHRGATMTDSRLYKGFIDSWK